jgi:hypothetical protein
VSAEAVQTVFVVFLCISLGPEPYPQVSTCSVWGRTFPVRYRTGKSLWSSIPALPTKCQL